MISTKKKFLFVQVPSTLTDELQLPSGKSTTKLDELVRNECNGEFHLKKFISKKTEQFLQVILHLHLLSNLSLSEIIDDEIQNCSHSSR